MGEICNSLSNTRSVFSDVNLCVFEWGQPGGQQVLLVHATGFHARCWDQVVAKLPDDWHIFAVDMRGHGRSDNVEPFTWAQFGDDLGLVCEALKLTDAIGVGHSMGGHCVTHVAGHNSRYFKHLVLVDPVIFAPDLYQKRDHQQYESVHDHPVARRRGHFASVEAMRERYVDRMPYKIWQREVFEDCCQFGLLPAASGDGLDLACPGYVEASIYMGNFDANLYQLLPKMKYPPWCLGLIRKTRTVWGNGFFVIANLARAGGPVSEGQDVHLPELTHFIPMQDPQLVADFICVGAETQGAGR